MQIVTKQANANVIETVDRIKTLIPELQRFLPGGHQGLRPQRPDLDDPCERQRTWSANAVRDHDRARDDGGVSSSCAGSTPTAAAGVTVPARALPGTCALHVCLPAFSIDNISLMALATSVGFVVDDAIVMIENDRFKNTTSAGMSPFEAALVGCEVRSALR